MHRNRIWSIVMVWLLLHVWLYEVWTAPDTSYSRSMLEYFFTVFFYVFMLDVMYQISLLKCFSGLCLKQSAWNTSPFHLVNNSTRIFSTFPCFLRNATHSFHESTPVTSDIVCIYLRMIQQCQHCLGVHEDRVRVY